MRFLMLSALVVWVLPVFSMEESFLLVNGTTEEVVVEMGPHVHQRISPCSTFKIALGLMGYDAGILKDENTPMWEFREGYDDFLDPWKAPQTPQSWMRYSCVWYSKLLALELGLEKIQSYLAAFSYGNQDMSGGLPPPGPDNPAWLDSSLKISPKEQVDFIRHILLGHFSVSANSIEKTKMLLLIPGVIQKLAPKVRQSPGIEIGGGGDSIKLNTIPSPANSIAGAFTRLRRQFLNHSGHEEESPEGWKLYGKTGAGSDRAEDGSTLAYSWFVGWIEKKDQFYPFAWLIRDQKIDFAKRIPRVKQLLVESKVMGGAWHD